MEFWHPPLPQAESLFFVALSAEAVTEGDMTALDGEEYTLL